jgi:putative ABC transport system permease protein
VKAARSIRFALTLALRESRHGLRRVGIYMASISLGVASLVSIHSFRDDVARSVQEEADVLMGANARIGSGRALPDSVTDVLDSLSAAGVGVSRVTTVGSMVLAPTSDEVRLLQVRAVDGGFPFYGAVTTRPEGLWGDELKSGAVLVDAAVLTQLDTRVGDSLVIGRSRLEIAGTVEDMPTDVGFQTAIGPRVYISQETLAGARLLGFGSLARYEVFLHLPSIDDREALRDRYGDIFRETRVRYSLAEEQAQSLSNGIRFLGRFLSLVGLAALLLGGVGVASAIHVYIRERRPGVAVLRCLGAGQWTAFLAYLIQAAGLGLLGATGGVLLGTGVQRALPFLLSDYLPVEVTTRLSPTSALAGLGVGLWVAVIFALIPLLKVRDVPPLQALRQDFEPERRRWDPYRIGAYLLVMASVLGLCALEAPEPEVGLAFAGALAVASAALAAIGWALTRVTRRFLPARAPYTVRQGISNLFRPQNQTISVTLALGFGAFVIGTVMEVEANLRADLTVGLGEGRPNMLFFDIQTDQLEGVLGLLPETTRSEAEVAPLIPSRVVEINGRSAAELRADTTLGLRRPEGWALRREYRNSYRAELGRAEALVSGRWWDGTPGEDDGTEIDAGGLKRVSLSLDAAEGLRVGLGDTITWEVSGVRIPSVVTSTRRVDWQRLEPNFLAIFEPGGLEDAPQTIIMIARLDDDARRAVIQRELVAGFPNVSVLDFSRVQEAIDAVLSRVRQAVGFLGAFSALAGVLVLIGTLATSRAQRIREGALLKTLGARRGQLLAVLFSEYLALGSLATASGLVLAWIASALIVPQLFELDYAIRVLPLVGIWVGVGGLTVLVGLAGSRGLLSRPPLAVLREAPE